MTRPLGHGPIAPSSHGGAAAQTLVCGAMLVLGLLMVAFAWQAEPELALARASIADSLYASGRVCESPVEPADVSVLLRETSWTNPDIQRLEAERDRIVALQNVFMAAGPSVGGRQRDSRSEVSSSPVSPSRWPSEVDLVGIQDRRKREILERREQFLRSIEALRRGDDAAALEILRGW